MKFIATVYETIKREIEVFAYSEKGAREMVADLGSLEFPYNETIEYEVNIEPVEE